MLETISKDWKAKAAIVIFILLSIWWIPGFLNPASYDHRYFGDYSSIYALMALLGGIWGVNIARKWGGFKSIMGKAILMFSFGLFAQVFGQIAYAYLAFYKNIEVPYPSIGDIGYFGSILFYTYGVWLLMHVSGARIQLKSLGNKLLVLVIPIIMLAIGYYLFLLKYEFDWSSPVRIFLDFGYPFGQAIYISLAILTYLLSNNVLGGMMRPKILFILFALLVQFLSDYVFLFQISRETWSNGGINEYMYLVAYFLMTLGLLQLGIVFSKLKHTE